MLSTDSYSTTIPGTTTSLNTQISMEKLFLLAFPSPLCYLVRSFIHLGSRSRKRLFLPSILGPIIGGSFGPNSDVPRAVHREYFRAVCPNVTLIHTEETKTKIASHDGLAMMNGWIEKLNSMEDRCIEFDIKSDQAFDIWSVSLTF